MKKLGIALMAIGLTVIGWFGYRYWYGMQSVTKVDEDIVKTSKTEDDLSTDTDRGDHLPSALDILFHSEEASETDDQDCEAIAQLVMPSIDLSFDVFWGTGDDALAKGVGMYDSEWTTPPDLGGHTVLSGHRDTVFQPVGDLQDDESIFINYEGEDYEYRITKTWITDADDHSVIVEKNEPTLTLSTCYPFRFIGSAPNRYIIQAEFVQKGDLLALE